MSLQQMTQLQIGITLVRFWVNLYNQP